MIEKILNAKHWQIFVIAFGIPMTLYFMWFASFMKKITELQNVSDSDLLTPQMMFGDMKYLFIFGIVLTFVLMLWQWSVATGLQNKIAPNLRLNLRTFKIFMLISIIFTVGYMYWLQSFFSSMMTMPLNTDPDEMQGMLSNMTIFMPLSLLAMACSLYIMYICAKTIKTAEEQSKMTFGDVIGEFIAIWFLPIGIWFLQPRINALMNKDVESDIMESLIE